MPPASVYNNAARYLLGRPSTIRAMPGRTRAVPPICELHKREGLQPAWPGRPQGRTGTFPVQTNVHYTALPPNYLRAPSCVATPPPPHAGFACPKRLPFFWRDRRDLRTRAFREPATAVAGRGTACTPLASSSPARELPHNTRVSRAFTRSLRRSTAATATARLIPSPNLRPLSTTGRAGRCRLLYHRTCRYLYTARRLRCGDAGSCAIYARAADDAALER